MWLCAAPSKLPSDDLPTPYRHLAIVDLPRHLGLKQQPSTRVLSIVEESAMPWPFNEMRAFVSRPIGSKNGSDPVLIVKQQLDFRAEFAFAMTHHESVLVNDVPFECPVAQEGIWGPGQLSQIAHNLTFGCASVIWPAGEWNDAQCPYIKRRGAVRQSICNPDQAKGAGQGLPAKLASVQPNGLAGGKRAERLVSLGPH